MPSVTDFIVILGAVMLSAVMLNGIVMLSVIMLSVVMPIVVAPPGAIKFSPTKLMQTQNFGGISFFFKITFYKDFCMVAKF
jgi:hypothetical protein